MCTEFWCETSGSVVLVRWWWSW